MRLRLDPHARVVADGVIGGSPTTYLRLTDVGRAMVVGLSTGGHQPVTPFIERLLDTGLAHPIVSDGLTHRYSAHDVTVVCPALNDTLSRGGLDGVDSVIVVDDGSTPALAGAAIRHEVPLGPGRSRNDGATNIDTPLVLFLDTGVALADGALDVLVAHFDDPTVALVAPRIMSLPGPSIRERYETGRSPLDLGPTPARIAPRSRVTYVPSAAIVVRTDAFTSVGRFDPELQFGEDVDLVWRLAAAGHRLRYEPAAVAFHRPRSTWNALLRQRFHYGTAAAPLSTRHGSAIAPVVCSPWSVLIWVLVAIGRAVPAGMIAGATVVTLRRKLPTLSIVECGRLTLHGHAMAGSQLLEACRRVWLPVVVLGAVRSSIARRVLLGALVAAAWPSPRHETWQRPTVTRQIADVPLRAVDDAAYCAGVWAGMLRNRTWGPILGDFNRAGATASATPLRVRVTSALRRVPRRNR